MKLVTLIIFFISFILLNLSYGCGKKNNIKFSINEELRVILLV